MWKEAYWANAIKDYVAIPAPYADAGLMEATNLEGATASVCLPESTRERLGKLIEDNDLDLSTLLFAVFSSFLSMSNSSVVPIWYSDEQYRRDVAGMTRLVSPFALCRVKVDDACGILEHYSQTEKQLFDGKKMRHFLFDIVYRYPQLRNGRSLDRVAAVCIRVSWRRRSTR